MVQKGTFTSIASVQGWPPTHFVLTHAAYSTVTWRRVQIGYIHTNPIAEGFQSKYFRKRNGRDRVRYANQDIHANLIGVTVSTKTLTPIMSA